MYHNNEIGSLFLEYSYDFQCFVSVNTWSPILVTQISIHIRYSQLLIKLKTTILYQKYMIFAIKYII